MPDKANAPERVNVVGTPTVEHALTGGATVVFVQTGVVSATPVPGTSEFVESPYPVNVSFAPMAATVKVPDWLADRVSGLPMGKVKLFSANWTVRAVAPADTLVTAVLVSSAKACAGEPGELLFRVTSVTEYPPTAAAKLMMLLPRTVVKPAAPQAVTPAAVELLHVSVVTPLLRLKNASACAFGLKPITNPMTANVASRVFFMLNPP